MPQDLSEVLQWFHHGFLLEYLLEVQLEDDSYSFRNIVKISPVVPLASAKSFSSLNFSWRSSKASAADFTVLLQELLSGFISELNRSWAQSLPYKASVEPTSLHLWFFKKRSWDFPQNFSGNLCSRYVPDRNIPQNTLGIPRALMHFSGFLAEFLQDFLPVYTIFFFQTLSTLNGHPSPKSTEKRFDCAPLGLSVGNRMVRRPYDVIL